MKTYEKPELEIIEFDNDDILLTDITRNQFQTKSRMFLNAMNNQIPDIIEIPE